MMHWLYILVLNIIATGIILNIHKGWCKPVIVLLFKYIYMCTVHSIDMILFYLFFYLCTGWGPQRKLLQSEHCISVFLCLSVILIFLNRKGYIYFCLDIKLFSYFFNSKFHNLFISTCCQEYMVFCTWAVDLLGCRTDTTIVSIFIYFNWIPIPIIL